MLRELLSIFKKDDPLASMGENFTGMVEISREMTLSAGRIYFAEDRHAEARTKLYERDVEVNTLERTIRKQVVAHLAIHANTPNLPYCLLLMSLVKDIERIGDYAKNLSEVMDIQPDPWPADDLIEEAGGEELFYRRYGISEEQEDLVKEEIRITLQVEKFVQDLGSDAAEPTDGRPG